MEIRLASSDELVAVMRLLDAAVLEAEASVVRERIDEHAVFVAEDERAKRVVGALVLDGSHVDAIAVQKERRGRGIGRALVDAASAAIDEALTVDFDERVRPFYASLGFEIESRDGRLWGVRRPVPE